MKAVLLTTMLIMNNVLNPARKVFFKDGNRKRKGMALVKLGGGVADIRGSIGGTTFSRTRYGAIARNRTIPVDPGSAAQTKIRSIASTVRNAWFNTLTAAQRTAWDTYAAGVQMTNRLGEVVNLTGWNHFCRSNMALLYNDKSLVAAGPTELSLPAQDPALAVSGSAASGDLTITFDDTMAWCDEDDAHMIIYCSRGQNTTVNFFKGPYLVAGTIDGDSVTPPTSTETVASPYTLINGQKVFIMARIVRADGRLSEPFRVSGSVGA